ncbi:hypothetical protein [Arcobacter sp. YIC-310]|uniref:hypothetical protein n=1 Tax=Arcobacter sp. YIC-310 TaxID=3376632 RepID=UPI003C22F0FC
MIKVFFSFFFLLSSLFSTEIVFNKIEEFKINQENILYIIKADIKHVDLKKLKKFKFFNKEQIISQASFYEKGTFIKENIKLHFKKAYFLEGDFIMKNIKGKINNYKIEAKKATYTSTDIILEKAFVIIDNKRVRRLKLTIPL